MRIGDVGSVSHVGDLLAFSLAIVLVLNLIYQVEITGNDDQDVETSNWTLNMIMIKTWPVFDPNGDGVIDLDMIHKRLNATVEPFPIEGDLIVTFLMDEFTLEIAFEDGFFKPEPFLSLDNVIVHGSSILVEISGRVQPCLMELSIIGGIE